VKTTKAMAQLSKALDGQLDEGLAGVERQLSNIEAMLRFILAAKKLTEQALREEKRYVRFLESEVRRLGKIAERHGERVTVLHRPASRKRGR
jgi:hypothetical protein